jgi:hypothetical protein
MSTQAKDGANFSLGKVPTQDVLASLLAQPIYVKAEGWLCNKVANCTDSVPLTRTVNQGLEQSPMLHRAVAAHSEGRIVSSPQSSTPMASIGQLPTLPF